MIIVTKENLEYFWTKVTALFARSVVGPSSSTDGHLVLFDGTTGKLAKDSGKSVSDFATAADMTTVKGYFSSGKLPWSNLSGVPSIVNTIGGKSGAITLKGDNTANGTINIAIDSSNVLSASIIGLQALAFKSGIAYNDLTTKPTAAQIQALVGSYVTTFAGKTGAITIKGDNTASGTVNLSIDSSKVLSAAIVGWDTKQDKIADVTDSASGYVQLVTQTNGKIAVTHKAFTTPVLTWANGTTAGPTLKVQTTSGTSAVKAVPSASASYSGIVTTGAQTFAGDKTFNGFVHSAKDLYGATGVAAGGITDTTRTSGGGSEYDLSADIVSSSLRLTLHPHDSVFEDSTVDITTSGLLSFTKVDSQLVVGLSADTIKNSLDSFWIRTDLLMESSKIKTAYLPDFLMGQVLYGGTVSASGVCTLTDNFKNKYSITSLTLSSTNASSYEGVYFIASANGSSGVPSTLGALTGDWIISTGSAWQKIDNTDAVTGVKGSSESTYRTGNINITKANIGLGSVEDTAISTWAGSTSITKVGTITSGTWNGTKIANAYLANSGFKIGTNTISLGSERTAAVFISDILGMIALTEAQIDTICV